MKPKCKICGCPDRPWLAPREVAAVLGCTPHTIRNMLDDGRLDGIYLGTERRVSHASVHARLAAGERTANPVRPVLRHAGPHW